MRIEPYPEAAIGAILAQRIAGGLSPEAISVDVLEHIASCAKGDAGIAIDLLRRCALNADRAGAGVVVADVGRELLTLRAERAEAAMRSLPAQSKLVLLAVLESGERIASDEEMTTGPLYEAYARLAERARMDVLSSRRVTDLLSGLAQQGLVEARVISRGRYGRSKHVRVLVDAGSARAFLGAALGRAET